MANNHPPNVDALLRLLVDQTKEFAIIILDANGRIASWNGGAEDIFGVPSADAVGQHASLLFTPEDVERGIPEHELVTAAADAAAEDDRWLKRPDGSRFWAIGVMRALRDENGRTLGFGKILRNRTDIREQLETVRNQLEASEATNRRKDLFLSTLSHELRNPLAPLVNAVHLIRVGAPSTPEMEYSLKIIERQVDSLRRLVDDLLDLSRIGAGKVELKRETVAIHEIMQRVVESVGPFARGRRHRLEVLLPPVPIIVDVDPVRMEQVFVNLVNNAVKYTPEGGRIWIKGTIEGDEAVVHIEDTGVGIPHEMLPRIFELFTQVETSLEQSQGGLGIGLSVVKELVTLHGGSVQVNSEGPGKGSIFSVRLPLCVVQE
jgi:PAS domain S-box-containing protein